MSPVISYNAGKSLPSAGAKSSFSYGKLINPTVINNGHTLQVALPADFKSDVSIPIRGERVQALNAQTFSCSCERLSCKLALRRLLLLLLLRQLWLYACLLLVQQAVSRTVHA
jgi:hypothetical protein